MATKTPICATTDCERETYENETMCWFCCVENDPDTDTDDDYSNYCDECGLHPKEAGMTWDGLFGYVELCRWCYIDTLKSKVERLEKDNTKLNKSLKKKTKLINKIRTTYAKEKHSIMLKNIEKDATIKCLKLGLDRFTKED